MRVEMLVNALRRISKENQLLGALSQALRRRRREEVKSSTGEQPTKLVTKYAARAGVEEEIRS